MNRSARKWSTVFFLTLVSAAACNRPAPFKVADRTPHDDVDAPFDPPSTYPGWAFDGPSYVKPVQELSPEPKAKPGDPLHYFTREKIVMIRQPSGYTPEEIPRIAVWWSDNNGFHWQKAGFFGREQSYFPFEVQEDGDYGVRFVGPGQEQSIHATAYPERVYHVDTAIPEVEVTIDPEQSWYNVGNSVTISWRADDYHLIESPVTLTALLDFTADESKPIEIQKSLAKEGSISYQIPPEALNHEMRFRVDALDRANNLGIAYSYALQIVPERIETPAVKPEDEKLEEQVSSNTPAMKNTPGRDAEPAPAAVEKIAKVEKPAPLNEEIIEEEPVASANQSRPEAHLSSGNSAAKVPYATQAARRTGPSTPSHETLAGDPRRFDNADSESSRASHGAGDYPEVAPAAAPIFTPIEPLDSQSESQSGSAGQPVSVVPTANSPDDLQLSLYTLQNGCLTDLTQGNGLLIPMPATFDSRGSAQASTPARPWTALGRAVETPLKTVWALPKADFIQRNPTLRNLFLAGAQMLRPLGEPGGQDAHVATLNTDPTDSTPAP